MRPPAPTRASRSTPRVRRCARWWPRARAPLGLPVDLSHVRRAPVEPSLELFHASDDRLEGLEDLAGCGDRPRIGVQIAGLPVGRGRRCRLDQRPEHDDRPGGHLALLELRLPATAAEIQSTTLAWLSPSRASASPRGAAISSASRKPLNSRLWLIRTGTKRQGDLDLACVAAAGGGRYPPPGYRHRAGLQRLHQRTAEHARRRPAEQLLGGAAPASHGAVPVGEHEAGIDELAQQLLDGPPRPARRSMSYRTPAVVGRCATPGTIGRARTSNMRRAVRALGAPAAAVRARARARPSRWRRARSAERAPAPRRSGSAGPGARRRRDGRGCSARARSASSPGTGPPHAARSATSCRPSARWPTSAPASLRAISAPSSNSRILPTSCSNRAHSSRSELSRGCSAQASSASVATATVCSSSPPR